MVEMQQQAFPSVEEAEAEHIVVDERRRWSKNNVDHAEPHPAVFRNDHLRAQRRVLVHVLDVIGEVGIGMVENSRVEVRDWSLDLNILVNGARFKSAGGTAKQAQFRIGPKTAVFNPTAEEKSLAREPIAEGESGKGDTGFALHLQDRLETVPNGVRNALLFFAKVLIGKRGRDLTGQPGADFLVRIQTQNPIAL